MNLSIVVPCYNEQSVLPETARRLIQLLDELTKEQLISGTNRIYFVDDGSRDQTWPIIESLAAECEAIKGIKLSRNRGHQQALLAGLLTVPGDMVISMDADLQDDLSAVAGMIRAHQGGAQIVYGVRNARPSDTGFKRVTAEGFYRMLRLLGVEVVVNHADFRLMSRRALQALGQYEEVNLFLRGLIPQLGFQTAAVYYERKERLAGESKYPLGKMLALAWDGITSFSAAPLRLITGFGFIVAIGSLATTVWAICIRLFGTTAVPGWASTVLPMYFLGGIQMLAIGVIGEYVAKIYMESKKRPRFIIEKAI